MPSLNKIQLLIINILLQYKNKQKFFMLITLIFKKLLKIVKNLNAVSAIFMNLLLNNVINAQEDVLNVQIATLVINVDMNIKTMAILVN